MNTDTKFLNRILSNLIHEYIEIKHYDQVSFIPESQNLFKIHKSINVMHHINKLRDRNHIIILNNAENAFDFSIYLHEKSSGDFKNRWSIPQSQNFSTPL